MKEFNIHFKLGDRPLQVRFLPVQEFLISSVEISREDDRHQQICVSYYTPGAEIQNELRIHAIEKPFPKVVAGHVNKHRVVNRLLSLLVRLNVDEAGMGFVDHALKLFFHWLGSTQILLDDPFDHFNTSLDAVLLHDLLQVSRLWFY